MAWAESDALRNSRFACFITSGKAPPRLVQQLTTLASCIFYLPSALVVHSSFFLFPYYRSLEQLIPPLSYYFLSPTGIPPLLLAPVHAPFLCSSLGAGHS